jgi:hypothetical protein
LPAFWIDPLGSGLTHDPSIAEEATMAIHQEF